MKDKDLTPAEIEILDMIHSGNYDIEQIANARECSVSLIYRYIRILKKKGWDIDTKCIGSKNNGLVSSQDIKYWRYHNLHFTITPYYTYPRYNKHIGQCEIIHGNWLVSIHKNAIEMQLRKNHSIKHKERWECIELMRHDFNKTLAYISNQYGFEYLKQRKISIKCVNGHLAQANSNLAENYKGNHLLIYGDDGKAWFEIDMSDTHEHEYRHPKHHISDSMHIEKHFDAMNMTKQLNALREHPHTLTLPELNQLISDTIILQKNQAETTAIFIEHFKSHTALVEGAVDLIQYQRKQLKELQKKAGQSKLTKFI